MEASIIIEGTSAVLKLSGDFTARDFRSFSDSYAEVLSLDILDIVVDLAEVKFADSGALGMLLILKEKFEEKNPSGKISIRDATKSVLKTLKTVHFDRIFKLEES